MTTAVAENKAKHPVPALFEHLGIKQIKPSDRFWLTYRDGIFEARVKRKSGQTESVIKYVKGNGFSQMTAFDPDLMTKDDRNNLIRILYKNGERQTSLERKFGLSQAMISRIVNA